jgi:hypothetical protein
LGQILLIHNRLNLGHNRVFNRCAYGGVVMFKVGDVIKIPEQTITLKGDDGVFVINGYFFIPGSLKALGAVKVNKGYDWDEMADKFDKLSCYEKERYLLSAMGIFKEKNVAIKLHAIYMAMGYKLENGLWYKVGEE